MAKTKKKSKDKLAKKPEVNSTLDNAQIQDQDQDQAQIEENQITDTLQTLEIAEVEETAANGDEVAAGEPSTEPSQETKRDEKINDEELKPQELQSVDRVEVEEQSLEPPPETTPEPETTAAQGPEQQPDQEVQTAAPVPKKRLTLQERLELAAKSAKTGKSKRATSGTTSGSGLKSKNSTPDPSPFSPVTSNKNSIDIIRTAQSIDTPAESTTTTRNASIEISRSDVQTLFPENFKELSTEDLWKIIAEAETKFLTVEFKNKSLTEEKHSLQDKVKGLNYSVNAASQKSTSQNDQIIKEKDERIALLLKEGEELSLKELKYNNTIKKLKSKEADNDYEIRELSKKVSVLESEKRELKDSLKKSQDAEKQATLSSKTFKIQLENEKESLKDEVSRNQQLSLKIEELSKVIVQEKNAYTKEINGLKRLVEKESQKFIVSKEEYLREVSRLEEKIEQLRFQAENAQAKTSNNDDGYAKLLRQYDVLQAQYTSATENWQSIEASLGAKINSYDSNASELAEKLEKSESKVSILSKDLSSKINEINQLHDNIGSLTTLKTKLEAKVQSLEKSLLELEELLEDKELRFNQDRSALEFKVQTLEKQAKDIIPQHLSVPDYPNSPLVSRNASLSSIKFNRGWESRDISFGESSTTPIQSRKTSSYFPGGNGSFIEEQEENYSDYGDNDTINSPVSQAYPASRIDNGSNTAIGGGSVQLLGKMSSQVRRLETELSSIKEELAKLNDDKKAANEEIVRLMKDNEQVENYKSQISELQTQVDSYAKRHERTLEILGEKSEQVEELKADVQDLKDLCKLQVQELIGLQNK